jgi:hypothetical protein
MKKMHARSILMMGLVVMLAFSAAVIPLKQAAAAPSFPMNITFPTDGSTISNNQPTITGEIGGNYPVYVYWWNGEEWQFICSTHSSSNAWSCDLVDAGFTLPKGENGILASVWDLYNCAFSISPCFGSGSRNTVLNPGQDVVWFTVGDSTPVWVFPDGTPNRIYNRQLPLDSMTEFTFNGVTYAPPEPWLLFAGQGLKVKFKSGAPNSEKICFAFPNGLNGWVGQIYLLKDGKWYAQVTTETTISGYGTLPFLCTTATQSGIYIVADHLAD